MKKYLLPLLLGSCAASPLYAQGYQGQPLVLPQEVSFVLEEPQGVLGTVLFDNLVTAGAMTYETYTFPTEEGDVVVAHTRLPNNNCNGTCYDTIEVVHVPDGFIAVPYKLDVAENGIGSITIMIWEGS